MTNFRFSSLVALAIVLLLFVSGSYATAAASATKETTPSSEPVASPLPPSDSPTTTTTTIAAASPQPTTTTTESIVVVAQEEVPSIVPSPNNQPLLDNNKQKENDVAQPEPQATQSTSSNEASAPAAATVVVTTTEPQQNSGDNAAAVTTEEVAAVVVAEQGGEEVAAVSLDEAAYAAVPTTDEYEGTPMFNNEDDAEEEGEARYTQTPAEFAAPLEDNDEDGKASTAQFNATLFAAEYDAVQNKTETFVQMVARVATLVTELEHTWLPEEDWSEEIAKHADNVVDDDEEPHSPPLDRPDTHQVTKKKSNGGDDQGKKKDADTLRAAEEVAELQKLLFKLGRHSSQQQQQQQHAVGCGPVDTLLESIQSQEVDIRDAFKLSAQMANDAFDEFNKQTIQQQQELNDEGEGSRPPRSEQQTRKLEKKQREAVALQQRLERATHRYSAELETVSRWSLKVYQTYYHCHQSDNRLEDAVGRWEALKAAHEEQEL